MTTDFAALASADAQATNKEPGAIELRGQCYEACKVDMEHVGPVHAYRRVAEPRPRRAEHPVLGLRREESDDVQEGRRRGALPLAGTAHVFIKAAKPRTTTRADQLFASLEMGTEYYVRVRTTIGRTTSDWGRAFSFTMQ